MLGYPFIGQSAGKSAVQDYIDYTFLDYIVILYMTLQRLHA